MNNFILIKILKEEYDYLFTLHFKNCNMIMQVDKLFCIMK